jgi:choline dehydrogenase-like flavoprotein
MLNPAISPGEFVPDASHEIYKPDDSMIPANLGVNPSLTITAMAEHAMSHIPPKEKE